MACAFVSGPTRRSGMNNAARAATDISAAKNSIESRRIYTVPDTNDWYLTTDEGIPLGPYGSREEAATVLALLRRQNRAQSADTDW